MFPFNIAVSFLDAKQRTTRNMAWYNSMFDINDIALLPNKYDKKKDKRGEYSTASLKLAHSSFVNSTFNSNNCAKQSSVSMVADIFRIRFNSRSASSLAVFEFPWPNRVSKANRSYL